MFIKNFFQHPTKVCLTYFEHLRFSLYVTKTLFVGSIKSLIHSFYPDIFITSTTDLLLELNKEMEKIGCRKQI
jgi:hypothetical protein